MGTVSTSYGRRPLMPLLIRQLCFSAAKCGGMLRFARHCGDEREPNIQPVTVWVDGLPYLVMETLREVPEKTELIYEVSLSQRVSLPPLTCKSGTRSMKLRCSRSGSTTLAWPHMRCTIASRSSPNCWHPSGGFLLGGSVVLRVSSRLCAAGIARCSTWMAGVVYFVSIEAMCRGPVGAL
jgi:hypothetical protein